MNLFSWRKKTHQLDALCWNLMVAATDPDRCWDMASTFRKTAVPGSVLTCETSFLMGSIVRDVIRSKVAGDKQRQCVMSAESAYFKTFDDQSDNDLPEEMRKVYGNIRLGHVARIALAAYAENNDLLLSTASIFVHRIKGDPRMKYEVMPIFEERKQVLASAFSKAL